MCMFVTGNFGMYVYSDRMQTVYHRSELYRGAFQIGFQPADLSRGTAGSGRRRRYFRRYDSQHFTKGNPQSG